MLQDYLEGNNDTKIQCMEAHNHRINAAEQAVQTFKNHFIAGLRTAHPDFRLQLWCKLLPHVEMTLNLLRTAAITNSLRALCTTENSTLTRPHWLHQEQKL